MYRNVTFVIRSFVLSVNSLSMVKLNALKMKRLLAQLLTIVIGVQGALRFLKRLKDAVIWIVKSASTDGAGHVAPIWRVSSITILWN